MSDLPINPLDLAVLLIVAVSAVFAFFRGLVHELLAIAGWAGAAFAAIFFSPQVKPLLAPYIANALLQDVAAGAAVFIVALIVLTLLSHYLARGVRESAFGPADRSLGLVFGAVRGFVVAALGYLLLLYVLEPPHPDWFRKARTLPALEWGAERLAALAPPEFRPPTRPDSPAPGQRPAGLADPAGRTGYNDRATR